MRTLIAFLAATLIAAAATAALAGPAAATPDNPTTGDRIVYVFISDVADNESSNWFDANNEITSFTNTHLPSWDADAAKWKGVQRVTSRSTYQAANSAFQTSGYYAGCEVWVNDTLVSRDWATGRFAVASC
jgi:hypothetical protein